MQLPSGSGVPIGIRYSEKIPRKLSRIPNGVVITGKYHVIARLKVKLVSYTSGFIEVEINSAVVPLA